MLIKSLRFLIQRTMSVFVQRHNPKLGKMEWEFQDENYDFHQEIARSGFADMLHDTERNQKYFRALKRTISKLHSENKQAHVLDIGTGSGLLSMMAVVCGADSVTACETFQPMAKCAKEIIQLNGFQDKINLIQKHSFDLKIGLDLPRKANILVTEVFDTELIGEGAIEIFNLAHKYLLEHDCIVIPESAKVFAQIVSSEFIYNWKNLNPVLFKDKILVDIPEVITNCTGTVAVHDIQMNQLPTDQFHLLSSSIEIFSFDFTGRSALMDHRQTIVTTKAIETGNAHVVFLWWELNMNGEILSCAPFWAHPNILNNYQDEHNSSAGSNTNILKTKRYLKDSIPWRDHWMQAVYFLPKPISIEKNTTLMLQANHSSYSFWFNLHVDTTYNEKFIQDNEIEQIKLLQIKDEQQKEPQCTCFAHMYLSRIRIGQLNSIHNQLLIRSLSEKIKRDQTVCLCLGDSILLSVAAARLGAKKVFCYSAGILFDKLLEMVAQKNGVADKITMLKENDLHESSNQLSDPISLVISEPYFSASLLPWHNLLFAHLFQSSFPNNATIDLMPKAAELYLVPMQFLHLHKIKSVLNTCEGFRMDAFDQFIQKSSGISDAEIEPQPLWEYTGNALSTPQLIAKFDFKQFNFNEKQKFKGQISLQCKSDQKIQLTGIALWIIWHLDDVTSLNQGLLGYSEDGHVLWDMHSKQAVYLLNQPIDIQSNDVFQYTMMYSPNDIRFKFRLNELCI